LKLGVIQCIINDPNDVIYPFPREMFENPRIIYHGTSIGYVERIEQMGWVMNGQPFDINDVKFVNNLCLTLKYEDYKDYSRVNLGWALANDEKGRIPASFTQIYWNACSYASNIGGETLYYLMIAIDN